MGEHDHEVSLHCRCPRNGRYRVIGVSLDEDGNYVYSRSSLVRNSKDFGVPQNRPRTYIMAFSKKIYGNAVKLLQNQMPMGWDKTVYQDVYAILDSNVDDKYYMAQGYLDTLKRHKERQEKKDTDSVIAL